MCTGSNCGYRAVWHSLRIQHQITVSKELIRRYLRVRDPSNVAARAIHRLRRRTYRSRGPNDCWHFDGYDKLKPYGLTVSGCVDGFSRRIIWLRCSSTNNDPAVIGCYYLDSVDRLQLCPSRIRSDRGSENSVVAALQCCLSSSMSSNIYGSSTSNQRIESLWAILRKNVSQWFIELMEDFIAGDLLDTSIDCDVECVRYCFMDLLQHQLDIFKQNWNTHRIRPTSTALCPGGIPDELYFLPNDDVEDCSIPVDSTCVMHLRQFVTKPSVCANPDVQAYFDYIFQYYGWNKSSTNWQHCVHLFTSLKNAITGLL